MPGLNYRQLRQQISIGQVLDLIGFLPTWQRGPQLRGRCPLPGCSSTSAQPFSVHLDQHVYRCFVCRSHGNALDLWVAIRGLSLHQAALELCQILHLDPPWLPAGRRAPRPTRQASFRTPPRNQ
jgi:DNA primase